jgi:hypothetical protein
VHAVTVRVKVDPNQEEQAIKIVREVVVPSAKELPGFASGNWLLALQRDLGMSVLLFESKEAAQGAREQIRSQGPPPGAPVTMEAVDVYEVVAQA